MANTILKEKNKVRGLTLPNLKTLLTYSNQDSMALAKAQTNRSIE